MRRALPGLIMVALPDVVHACAVCGAAVDRSKSVFLGTTILLSLLPLALIGAGLWWIARNAGGHLAGELAEVELPVGSPGPGSDTGAQGPQMVAPRQADLPGRPFGSGGWI